MNSPEREKKKAANKSRSEAMKRFWKWRNEGLKRGHKGKALREFIERKQRKYVIEQLHNILPAVVSLCCAGYVYDALKNALVEPKKGAGR